MIHKTFSDFELFHLHGNVHGGSFPIFCSNKLIELFPKVIELTFIRKNLCKNLGVEIEKFPIEKLDSVNCAGGVDFCLDWVNK